MSARVKEVCLEQTPRDINYLFFIRIRLCYGNNRTDASGNAINSQNRIPKRGILLFNSTLQNLLLRSQTRRLGMMGSSFTLFLLFFIPFHLFVSSASDQATTTLRGKFSFDFSQPLKID